MLTYIGQLLKISLAAGLITGLAFVVVAEVKQRTGADESRAGQTVSSPAPSSESSPTANPDETGAVSVQTETAPSSLTEKDKRQLDTSARKFVRSYFSREATQTEEEHRAAIRPYTSSYFERKFYRFEPLQPDHSRVVAVSRGHSYGTYHMPEKDQQPIVAEVRIPVLLTVYDVDGEVVLTTDISQQMSWKFTKGGWKIHSLM